MSRRLILAAGRRTSVVVTPPDPTAGYPDTADEILLALRPHGRSVGSRVVEADDTVGAGVDASKADQVTDTSTGSLGWDGIGPDYRGDVFIQPGTHDESVGTGAWLALVGTTGNPADVILTAEGDGAGGTIHSFGATYLEGLTLDARERVSDGYSPKYPWHITGGEMNVAAHCTFDTTAANSTTPGHGTAGLVGMDGISGATVIFYRCTFKAGTADGFNMHGVSNGQPIAEPITWIFAECDLIDVAQISVSTDAVTGGRKNRLYVVGCTGVQTIVADTNTDVFTDSDAPVTGAASTTRGVTEWPIPADGLSELWAGYYYPSRVGLTTRYVPTVTDAAPFTPPAGRHYATKIQPPYAMRSRRALVVGAATGGLFKAAQQPVDTAYTRNDPPDVTFGLTADQAFVAGDNLLSHYYWQTRYPGDNGWWVHSKFNGAASVTGSAQVGESYYSDNGTTWTAVPEGQPVPLIGLRDSPT